MPPQRRKMPPPDPVAAPLSTATALDAPPDLNDNDVLADVLGLDDITPLDVIGGGLVSGGVKRIGHAARRLGHRTGPSGAGTQIPKGGQSGVDATHKIPRFRSPAGDFVRYQNKWWRLKPFAADATEFVLEDLGPGAKDLTSKVLNSVTVNAKKFYRDIVKANKARLKAKGGGG